MNTTFRSSHINDARTMTLEETLWASITIQFIAPFPRKQKNTRLSIKKPKTTQESTLTGHRNGTSSSCCQGTTNNHRLTHELRAAPNHSQRLLYY